MNLSKKITQCFHYLLAILIAFGIIISSTTVFSVDSRKKTIIVTVLSMLVYLICGLIQKKRRIPGAGVIVLMLYCPISLLMLTVLTTPDMTTYYIDFALLLPLAFFLFCFMTEKERKTAGKMFVLTASFIGVVSVLLFYGLQLGILHPTGYWISRWTLFPERVAHFHHLQYLTQPGRNTSFFPEGPAYNYLLSTALLCNTALVKYKPVLINTILVISILTTSTTTGLIVVTALAVYWIATMPVKNSLAKLALILLVMIAFVVAFIYLQQVMLVKMEGHSGTVRSAKMKDEIEAFLNSPLIGHGLGSYSSGSSNSVTSLLADGGVFLWGLYYFPIAAIFVRDIVVKKKINYCIVIYTFLFAVCVFQYFTLSLVITAFFWYSLMIQKSQKKVVRLSRNTQMQLLFTALSTYGKES